MIRLELGEPGGGDRVIDEAQIIDRLLRKARIPTDQVTLLHRDIRYWQARACGWDAFSVRLRRDLWRQDLIHEPARSDFWKWWTKLHYKTRETLIAASRLCAERVH